MDLGHAGCPPSPCLRLLAHFRMCESSVGTTTAHIYCSCNVNLQGPMKRERTMWLCSSASAGQELRILAGRTNTGVVDACMAQFLGKPDTQWQMVMLRLPSALLVLLYRQTRYELDQVSVGQVFAGHMCNTNLRCLRQARKHLRPELLARAAAANIIIRAIDPLKPVVEQGPFDLILQKCRDEGILRAWTLHMVLHTFAGNTKLFAFCVMCLVDHASGLEL